LEKILPAPMFAGDRFQQAEVQQKSAFEN